MKKFGRKTILNLRYGSDKGSHSVVSDWKGCGFMGTETKVSFDSTKNEKIKVTELYLIFRMIGKKPYYEIKYKKVGEDCYNVGYSSYYVDYVLKWKKECFEIVEKKTTNADRIRNMSDEELAELIIGSLNFDCANYCDSFAQGCAFNCGKKKDREIALKWLQSEAEWGSIKNE